MYIQNYPDYEASYAVSFMSKSKQMNTFNNSNNNSLTVLSVEAKTINVKMLTVFRTMLMLAINAKMYSKC